MKYIDTSVIVSALDPADPSGISSIEVLKTPGKVISEPVIMELSSVLSRNKNFVTLMDELSGDRATSSYAAILYILQKFDLLFLPLQQTRVETPIGEYGNIISFAIEITKDVPMKILDLLHLSYAHAILESTKSDVEFVTRDREFEVYKSEIYRTAGVRVSYLA
ncbi:MAG: type II toxin-antitoxin system VapC family toxin [Thermoplasmata archaeon]